jgi:NitT/TauT family transport system substrate-binding protein
MLDRRPRRGTLIAAAALALGTASATVVGVGPAGAHSTARPHAPFTLRLGYDPNLTHATALVGVQEGIFQKYLGKTATLSTATFNSGVPAIQALLAGSIDATYTGPNPALSGFTSSNGKALQVISGATSGGAGLVVKSSITNVSQLKGTTLASPQLGNTQDVALRYWLLKHGLKTTTTGGGAVHITPETNSLIVTQFLAGQIAGAWVPEPWLTELVQQGHGRVLVNERNLWPQHRFTTTMLVASQSLIKNHPAVVHALLEGQVATNIFLRNNVSRAQSDANKAITALTGKGLHNSELKAAWSDMLFTDDPIGTSIATDVKHAQAVGLLGAVSLKGFYDLAPLNQILKSKGIKPVSS